MRVLVIGAGVIGLTVAVRLAEAGHDVEVLARDLPLETTSAIAAAIWYPYRIQPADRALPWAATSFAQFRRIAEAEGDEAGVWMRDGVELFREQVDDPWWLPAVDGVRRVDVLPAGYRDGWSFVTPIIETPRYLRWLAGRLVALGGSITRMALSRLPNHAARVVNCTGLGARGLAGDPSVEPVRGQVVRLSQPGLDRWLIDGSGLTYVVPRSHDVVVGGTDQEGSWDRRIDRPTAERILERARALVPELRHADVIGHKVGLRPARPSVRLEQERLDGGGQVVHCYGHGGAGVTVSWGCANEVAALVDAAE